MRESKIYEEHEKAELLTSLLQPHPTVIALEGGPCGGKTTIIDRLRHQAEASGKDVIVLPEVATDIIVDLASRGIDFARLATNNRTAFLQVERDILAAIKLQLTTAIEEYQGTDTIIVTDRADIAAYVTEEEYQMLSEGYSHFTQLIDVVHYLPSLAQLDPDLYRQLQSGNSARYESVEDAIDTCNRNLRAASRHPELVLHWGGDFDMTVARVVEDVMNHTVEREVRFAHDSAVERDGAIGALLAMSESELSVCAIEQSYHSAVDLEYRLRRGVMGTGEVFYHLTVKEGTGEQRTEINRNLSAKEFDVLNRDRIGSIVRKVRTRHRTSVGVVSLDEYEGGATQIEFEGVTSDSLPFNSIPGFIKGGLNARDIAII